MTWPLSQDYNEAIQDPGLCFTDPDLVVSEPVTNALGLPLPRSGNFADVYELRSPATGRRWAVKCFTRPIPGLRERYAAVSRHLGQAGLKFMVDFQYLEQGIRVRGQWYPVLKMDWVEGHLLNDFVRQQLDRPAMLEALGQVWVRLARRLREASIAHGDLQHGNVLLVPGRDEKHLAVKLIDYDGMWVPALAGQRSGEVGHPAYQHPQRLREATYAAEVDRFPVLLVGTALRAVLACGPGLWQRHDNGDNLLFREADLREPHKSPLFRELWQVDDAAVHALTGYLTLACHGKMAYVLLLDQLVTDEGIRPLNRVQEESVTALLGPGARVTRGVTAAPVRVPAAPEPQAVAVPAAPPVRLPPASPLLPEPVVVAELLTPRLPSRPIIRPAAPPETRRAGCLGAMAGLAVLSVVTVLVLVAFLANVKWPPTAIPRHSTELVQRPPVPPEDPPAPPPPVPERGETKKDTGQDRPSDTANELPPARKMGHLLLLGWREGDKLSVDGVERPGPDKADNLGASFSVEPGTRKLKVCRPDHDPWENELTIKAGQVVSLTVQPKQLTGTLVLKNLLPEAQVLLGGKVAELKRDEDGTSGSISLNPGEHDVRVTAEGFQPYTDRVSIRAREPVERSVTMEVQLLPRRRAPRPAVQEDLAKQVREMFKDDFARQEPAAQRALAGKLWRRGAKTGAERDLRFALFLAAGDQAARGGDQALALKAVDLLGKEYEVDAVELRVRVFQALGDAADHLVAGPEALAESVLGVAGDLLAQKKYEAADRLLAIADRAAKNHPVLAKRVAEKRGIVKKEREARENLEKENERRAKRTLEDATHLLNEADAERRKGDMAAALKHEEKAKALLQEVVDRYPATGAAQMARKLLDSLER